MKILITSGYGANTRKPFVRMEAETLDAPLYMSPQDARDVAMNLLRSAEASETDGLLIEYLQDELSLDDPAVAAVLLNLRQKRDKLP